MNRLIHSHQLDNGVVVVAEPNPALQSAAFTLLVPAGCIHDPTGRSGLASFSCEMALRGAGPRNSRQLVDALDAHGVERSESVTSSHMTCTGATHADNLPVALEIFTDVVRRPHLPDDELDAGRQVMLQELMGIEDDPAQRVLIELKRRRYGAPWGNPSHGDVAGIQATTADDVRNFIAQYYRPQGTVLGVAGNFDWPRLLDHVEGLFADWQVPSLAEPDIEPGPVETTHVPDDTKQTQIGVAFPSAAYRDEDGYFQALGAVGALSGGMSSRLFTEVREKRGLCYSVYATNHTLKTVGSVLCYAGTSADRAQETLDVLIAELVRLAKGVEESEVQRLRARVKSSLVMQQESSAARSSMLARDWYHLGRIRGLDEVGRHVDALSADSINNYLRQHPPADFSVVTLGPNRLEIPLEVS